jgi:hypothetical protein
MTKEYTLQQIKFVDKYLELSVENDNYREVSQEAKKFAGYSENTPVSTIIKSVKDLILEEMNLRLAQMAPKLLNGLDTVLDEPSMPGADTLLKAISQGLDRVGIVKVDKSTMEVKAPDGILILPSKNKPAEEAVE